MWKSDKLHLWFFNSETQSQDKRYKHRLLQENLNQRGDVFESLKNLVKLAHEDARRHFRGFTANTLAPNDFSSEYDLAKSYPQFLPLTTLKGYFGEILAGLIAENFSPFEIDDWQVPAFLFRFHDAAFNTLERAKNTGAPVKTIFGRTGNDCLAFQLSNNGYIRRSLVCEAKCTSSHDIKLIASVHKQISDVGLRPTSLWQIVHILKDRQTESNDQNAKNWIIALELLQQGTISDNYERCDLITYVCGHFPKEENRDAWLCKTKPHKNYTGGRRLEAVEIHLHEVDSLIQGIYGTSDYASEKTAQTVTLNVKSEGELVNLVQEQRDKLAGHFPPRFAKLYSHYSRLRNQQEGLPSWREDETQKRIDDAVRLLQAALIERDADSESDWCDSARRAGELLEWLSHPEINVEKLPIRLLAAASYQLAGYPARASGLLNATTPDDNESKILLALLKADFITLQKELTSYWGGNISPTAQTITESYWSSPFDNFHQLVVTETVKALGVLCAEMRWGDEERLGKAIEKLTNISNMMLYGNDPYAWLLAKLCVEVTSIYIESSMRAHLESYSVGMNPRGKKAVENYIRLSYQASKSLLWPSQVLGIKQLVREESFTLCTPTGSGKTTVAELGILQSLFPERNLSNDENLNLSDVVMPFAIYLVPSRALAAEIESKLSRALHRLKAEIIVASLYGGTDWGPTDAWLTEENPTVLICTYEKAEALMRFLGPLFRNRISLVVIDEAHFVEFGEDQRALRDLREAENRALRLEALGTRLFTHLDTQGSRAIALSAVAAKMENVLASWVKGEPGTVAEKTLYRSTRQLIGRLECLPQNRFEIRYDLLDGASLKYDIGDKDTPFIPNPFPPHPPLQNSKVSGTRPYLFWAAMQLAKPDERGQQHTVLISITQHINRYARDFLEILDVWQKDVPDFFQPPEEGSHKWEMWNDCLKSCKDYFTDRSHEYRLLQKGIIVHHGKMPGLLPRLLIELIQKQIIHLVLATSTLTDGVNLPFETILIPSLRRSGRLINVREFSNLIGRAGRPGFGTEGRSLVLLSPDSKERSHYNKLIRTLGVQAGINEERPDSAKSPLAELLVHLEEQFQRITNITDEDEFLNWLEKTAPLDFDDELPEVIDLIKTLDSLDAILLSSVVEIEQANQDELSADELEEKLRKVWQRSFARYAYQEQARLAKLFVRRGIALQTKIYPQSSDRKRLYRTSLPPRSGNQLLQLYPEVINQLKTGFEYTKWGMYEQFDYVKSIVQLLGTLPKYKLNTRQGDWVNLLMWWFDLFLGTKQPSIDQISDWHNDVSQNFGYRFNWGLGSVISLAMVETFGDLLPSLDDWPQTGLPWVAFWLKELIVWGTLDPVAAYLLSQRVEITRNDAQKTAKQYYSEQPKNKKPDELLNVVSIRRWVEDLSTKRQNPLSGPPRPIQVDLLRDFRKVSKDQWRVVPVETDEKLYWFDIAGSPLASCYKFDNWQSSYLDTHDFVLDTSKKVVSSQPYI